MFYIVVVAAAAAAAPATTALRRPSIHSAVDTAAEFVEESMKKDPLNFSVAIVFEVVRRIWTKSIIKNV